MRLYSKKWGVNIELSDVKPTTMVVEKSEVYADICNDIWVQSLGMEGNVMLTDKSDELKLSKSAVAIFNPFAVSCNDKKIISKLYKEMKETAMESYYEETSEVLSKIVNYIDLLSMEMQYPIVFNNELNSEGLYKLFEVSVDDDSMNLLGKLANYIKMINRIAKINIVITIGLKRYLSSVELEELYKEISYEKVFLINLENSYDCKIGDEQIIIIDKDLCQIDLD